MICNRDIDGEQFDNLILAAVEPTRLGVLDSASSSLKLMKRLQYMLDQALRTAHMLDLNIEVMKMMQIAALKSRKLDIEGARQRYADLNEGLETAISEHMLLQSNVMSLVARATVLSNQVSALSHFLCSPHTCFLLKLQERHWLRLSKASRHNTLPQQ